MLQAVQAVRPGPGTVRSILERRAEGTIYRSRSNNPSRQRPDLAGLCGGSAAQTRGLPIDRVERELRSNQDHDAALQEFNQAPAKAAEIMKANCHSDQPLPNGPSRSHGGPAYTHAARFGSGAAGAREILCLAQRRAEGAV